MPHELSRSLVLGIVVLFIAGAAWHQAAQLPDMQTDLSVVNAAFFPRVIAVLLAALAVGVMWCGRSSQNDIIALTPSREFCKAAAVVCLVIAYNVCLPLGFEIVSPLFLLFCMLLLGVRKWRVLILLPLVATAIIHIIFIRVMYVPIPSLL